MTLALKNQNDGRIVPQYRAHKQEKVSEDQITMSQDKAHKMLMHMTF